PRDLIESASSSISNRSRLGMLWGEESIRLTSTISIRVGAVIDADSLGMCPALHEVVVAAAARLPQQPGGCQVAIENPIFDLILSQPADRAKANLDLALAGVMLANPAHGAHPVSVSWRVVRINEARAGDA